MKQDGKGCSRKFTVPLAGPPPVRVGVKTTRGAEAGDTTARGAAPTATVCLPPPGYQRRTGAGSSLPAGNAHVCAFTQALSSAERPAEGLRCLPASCHDLCVPQFPQEVEFCLGARPRFPTAPAAPAPGCTEAELHAASCSASFRCTEQPRPRSPPFPPAPIPRWLLHGARTSHTGCSNPRRTPLLFLRRCF